MNSKKKIIFINRFFYPDQSASSQLLSDLAFWIGDNTQEIEVNIITSQICHSTPNIYLPHFEKIDQINIHRLRTTQFGTSSLIGRLIDYITFYISLFFKLLIFVKAGDTVVCKTDPPLISIIALPIVKIKKAFLINWLQDIFPEIATALKVPYLGGFLAKVLIKLRNSSLKHAKANVVISEEMAKTLQNHDIPLHTIHVQHNWADSKQLKPVANNANSLLPTYKKADSFIVGYSGNMGRVHDFNTIINAAKLLKNQPDIIFEFVGYGPQKAWITNQAKQHK
ncbi:MAG: glycosyltransferase family 4 protein, partial [Magnetococcales bacterium]|nr:glycosyltransferase family 4 protein [Magnetococcales bacterium]